MWLQGPWSFRAISNPLSFILSPNREVGEVPLCGEEDSLLGLYVKASVQILASASAEGGLFLKRPGVALQEGKKILII